MLWYLRISRNQGLLHCRHILYQLSYQGSPFKNTPNSSLQIDSLSDVSVRISHTATRLRVGSGASGLKSTSKKFNPTPIWPFAAYPYLICLLLGTVYLLGLPRWFSGKESIGQYRRCRRSRFDPWFGNGNPLQYSWLENPMDRGGWRATVLGVIHEHACTFTYWSPLNPFPPYDPKGFAGDLLLF